MTDNDKSALLSDIHYPDDLRKLTPENLEQVSAELRQVIIDELSSNPGHFASSLGVVELTVALHYVFNTPYDRIVWDVGHQAYAHKLLTGRRNDFHSNRKFKGLSGFPTPSESIYDSFTAGHASNSISAALGMAVASTLNNEHNRHVIAVIGDAAISGGLAFEGLNNASSHPNNLLIILNDNNMAIDRNVGGLNQYLVGITTSRPYNKLRYDLYRVFKKANLIDEGMKGAILRFNNSLKSLITRQHNIFEGLDIRYFGPVDGHDIESLVRILDQIKDMKGPKILHLRTVKGKGFKPAEDAATEWHAPGRFNKETGERIIKSTTGEPPLFQEVFGHTLVELARTNPKIVGITPAMPSGSSMTQMMNVFPERSFDVGIAEEHAVTFSGGLAAEGMIPFCNIYSSFMQRAYDQVIHDVSIQNLPVVFCLDRAGLVGEDGPTHHGVFDLSYFRVIPNMTVASPINEHWLRNLMYTAQKNAQGPFMIRYPRGKGSQPDWKSEFTEIKIGKGYQLKDGNEIALLSIGPIGNTAAKAIQLAEQKGISIAHYDMVFLKPLDEELLHQIFKRFKKIITLEDGALKGGFGSAILEFMSDHDYHAQIKRIGIPDQYIEHGSIDELYKLCGMDIDSIYERICMNW